MKNLTLIVAFFIVFIVIVLIGFNFLAFVYIYYTENQTITPGYSYNIVRHIDNAEEGLYLNWIESFNFQIITNEKNNIQTTSQSLLINTITANDLSALQNWGNYWGKSAKINIDYSTDVFIENMTLGYQDYNLLIHLNQSNKNFTLMTNFIHVNQSNSFIQPQSMYDFNFTENYCLIEQHLSIYSLFSPGDARYFNLNQISILDKNFYIFIFSNEATTMVS